MTAPNGDRITVQRVTSSVAGEYREWTITVRQSSPADRPESELTRVGAVAVLPTAVRDWLSAWLEGRMVHAGEHILRPPLLVGRDFAVGDRVRGGERAPMFPLGKTEPAAPYAGRTAPRRTLPPEAPVRLWNRDHTDHLDVTGRACDLEREGTHVRVRLAQSQTALAWLHGHALITDGGTAYVVWMDREWTVAGYSSTTNTGLVLDLLPIPKPPRVDQVLHREDLAIDLGPARPKITPPDGAPYAGPFPDLQAGDKIGVEHPDGTITTHEFSGDPAQPVADETGRLTRMAGAVDKMRAALREDFPDVNYTAPAPEAYTLPDGVGLGTVPRHADAPKPGPLHFQTGKPFTGYADLYARLDAIHDAVAEEES